MRLGLFVAITAGAAGSLFGSSISVVTSASATATYPTFIQSAGPFPWSDLGITANASVSGGILNVVTGGSTAYNLTSTVTGSEPFIPGSTALQLAYTPGWTGSITSGPAATGSLSSQFVYNIGPISGSNTLFSAPLFSPSVNDSLTSSLNVGLGIPAINSQSASGLGISAGATLSAQAGLCPFCVTVASASLNFNVGSRIDQTVSGNPFVTNADLVWYSTSQTYSPSDTFTLVTGLGGNINNVFMTPPSSLGLTNGETFYMNILPVVELDMPVTNFAEVAVPASITASWNVFGAGGSANFPLGDLYTLSNGGQTFDFDATFYGSFFYSQPLVFSFSCPFAGIACFGSYATPPSSGGPNQVNTGIPINLPPSVTLTGGGPTPGGYGNVNPGPLFPGDPSSNPVCGPVGSAFAGDCITQITETPTPEPGSLLLLGTGLALLAGRLRRKRM